MKISIDTKEDSHEDIRKVIKMLKHLVGDDSYSNQGNIFSDDNSGSSSPPSSDSSNEPTNAFGAMFGDDSPALNQDDGSSNLESSETNEEKKESNIGKEIDIVPY